MDLICPDCRGELQMVSARGAVCAQHGGRFEVLFDRNASRTVKSAAPDVVSETSEPQSGAAVVLVPATAPMCKVHARQIAVAACPSCGTQLCTLCSFDVNGKAFCADCAIAEAQARPRAGQKICPDCGLSMPSAARQCNCGHHFGMLNLTPVRTRNVAVVAGTCTTHPEMQAVAHCKLCTKPICTTCDFALAGGVHLCPSCIENYSAEEVNPKRTRQTYIALALGAWSTILFLLLFAGAFSSLFTKDAEGRVADLLITNIILWPLLIGTGLSIGALDKKLKNTGLMKAVAWWNGIMAGIFVLILIGVNVGLIGN